MKKRILFVVAMASLALNVYAADSDFTVDANGVITKYAGWDTEVTIPATIGGKKITAIGKEAFRKADLTGVVIPEGIAEIREYAFAENNLTTVTIPGSVKTIMQGAFDGNKDLSTVILSEGLEYVVSAFPSTVKSINIPASVRNFHVSFDKGTSVTLAANIPADLYQVSRTIYCNYITNDRKAETYTQDMKCDRKSADGYTYYETQYGAVLIDYSGDSTRVRIPAEIGDVAVKAMYGTFDGGGYYDSRGKIVAVQIPESITYIGCETFKHNQLQSIAIPQSVTYIGDSAFWNNELTTVDIPASVQYIGDDAFKQNNLTAVTLSGGVQYIGARAFSDHTEYGSYSTFRTDDNHNKLTSITIPTSVTYIGESAFDGIKAITIPASVKSLGGTPILDQTFYSTGNSIVIGANVSIGGGGDFGRDYNKNGRKAGRYTLTEIRYDETWVYSAK